MTVTRESLTARFKLYNDDELLRVLNSTDMTPLAHEVAGAELRERGIDPAKREVEVASEEPAEEAPPNVGEGDLVPVARFLTPMEAQMLRSRLEVDGVSATVVDANLVQANPFLSGIVGGVRVLVPEAHLERAQEIVEAIRRGDYALRDGEDA